MWIPSRRSLCSQQLAAFFIAGKCTRKLSDLGLIQREWRKRSSNFYPTLGTLQGSRSEFKRKMRWIKQLYLRIWRSFAFSIFGWTRIHSWSKAVWVLDENHLSLSNKPTLHSSIFSPKLWLSQDHPYWEGSQLLTFSQWKRWGLFWRIWLLHRSPIKSSV